MTDTCNHEPVQQLSASENEKWSCKKCGKPVPAPDTKGFVSPEELFKTVEKGRKMMQKPKDGWGEDFDKRFVRERAPGVAMKYVNAFACELKSFIKEVESQAEQRGRDEREGELERVREAHRAYLQRLAEKLGVIPQETDK